MKHNLKVFAVAVTVMAVVVIGLNVVVSQFIGLEPSTLIGAIIGGLVGVIIAAIASIYYDT